MRGTFGLTADRARRVAGRYMADNASVSSKVSDAFGKPAGMGCVTTFVATIDKNRAWTDKVGVTRR